MIPISRREFFGFAGAFIGSSLLGGPKKDVKISPVDFKIEVDYSMARLNTEWLKSVELTQFQETILGNRGIKPYLAFGSRIFSDSDGNGYRRLAVFGTVLGEDLNGASEAEVTLHDSICTVDSFGAVGDVILGYRVVDDKSKGIIVESGRVEFVKGSLVLTQNEPLFNIPVNRDGKVLSAGAVIFDKSGKKHQLTKQGIEILLAKPQLDM